MCYTMLAILQAIIHIENKINMYINTYIFNKVWCIKICCRMISPFKNSYCYFPGSSVGCSFPIISLGAEVGTFSAT